MIARGLVIALATVMLAGCGGCSGSSDSDVDVTVDVPPIGPICLVVNNTPIALAGCTATRAPTTTPTATPTPTPHPSP